MAKDLGGSRNLQSKIVWSPSLSKSFYLVQNWNRSWNSTIEEKTKPGRFSPPILSSATKAKGKQEKMVVRSIRENVEGFEKNPSQKSVTQYQWGKTVVAFFYNGRQQTNLTYLEYHSSGKQHNVVHYSILEAAGNFTPKKQTRQQEC